MNRSSYDWNKWDQLAYQNKICDRLINKGYSFDLLIAVVSSIRTKIPQYKSKAPSSYSYDMYTRWNENCCICFPFVPTEILLLTSHE